MKIMIFTEGTILGHSNWIGLAREEIVQRVRKGEQPEYSGTIPIGNASGKLRTWSQAGAEILYLTSRRSLDEIEQVREILRRYDFPQGELFFRRAGEAYKDAAERAMPAILIEDDCESIGGEVEMTYPHIQPEIKAKISSVVVREFGGIDHLPESLAELMNYQHCT
jgi:hypothetical protein